MKKRISMLLSACLVLTMAFSVPFVSSAVENGGIQFQTIKNNYDESNITYAEAVTENYWASTYSVNGGAAKRLSIYGASVRDDSTGNKAIRVHHTATVNSDWPTGIKILDSNNNYSLYKPELNSKYRMTLRYKMSKVATENIKADLRWTSAEGDTSVSYTYVNEYHYIGNLFKVAKSTTDTEWKTAVLDFTVGSQYNVNGASLYIALTSDEQYNGTNSIALWIDDIEITKYENIVCNNWNGQNATCQISPVTKFSDLEKPTRSGYIFQGFYKDAALSEKAADDELVCNSSEIWAKWSITSALPVENSYDEGTVTYAEGAYEGGLSGVYSVNGGSNISLSQFGSSVKTVSTENNAIRIDRAPVSNTDWPTAFHILDSNNNYQYYTPELNNRYRLVLKYKMETAASQNIKVDLRWTNESDSMSVAYQWVDEFHYIGNIFSVDSATVNDQWQTAVLEFTVGSAYKLSGSSLYVAVTTDTEYNSADNMTLWIDDIKISPVLENHLSADVNDDQVTTIADLIRLKKMAAGSIAKNIAGDVNDDCEIAESSDLIALRRILLGVTSD